MSYTIKSIQVVFKKLFLTLLKGSVNFPSKFLKYMLIFKIHANRIR